MAIPADVGAAVAALPSLGISEDLATDLRNFLTEGAGELVESTPQQTATGAFGSSPASRQCASDAHKARARVAQAILDMSTALKGYGGVVTDLYRNVTAVDDTAHADLARKAAQADACVAPSFATPSTCRLPGNSPGGS
jgi:hypothetical protein